MHGCDRRQTSAEVDTQQIDELSGGDEGRKQRDVIALTAVDQVVRWWQAVGNENGWDTARQEFIEVMNAPL